MHTMSMRYLMVAAAGVVVGLLATGTSVQSLLPFLLLLACPLMMVFMMRGMGGDHQGEHDDAAHHDSKDSSPARPLPRPGHRS